MTTVVILHSNYIPWRDYSDLPRHADHFVFFDSVQFTKSNWGNKHRVISPKGPV